MKFEIRNASNGKILKIYNPYAEEKKYEVVIEEHGNEHDAFDSLVGVLREEIGLYGGKYEEKNYRSCWLPGSEFSHIEDITQVHSMIDLCGELLSALSRQYEHEKNSLPKENEWSNTEAVIAAVKAYRRAINAKYNG